jgi:hypothetical protein
MVPLTFFHEPSPNVVGEIDRHCLLEMWLVMNKG